MATYNNIKKIKIGDNTFNLYDSGNSGGTITSVETTAGAHSAINVTNGAASFNVPTTAAHVGINFGYITSGNNRAVQQDSSGNLYVTQTDTNTYVTQTADTTETWRKVLGTYNSGSTATATITSETSNIAYYDADGPAFNPSTGELYTQGYYVYLATTDALYTAIDNLGWTDDVII